MEAVHRAALALGTANQLTNILRDVGEDAVERNRIYVPRDELDMFGISEAEVRVPQGPSLLTCRHMPAHTCTCQHSISISKDSHLWGRACQGCF